MTDITDKPNNLEDSATGNSADCDGTHNVESSARLIAALSPFAVGGFVEFDEKRNCVILHYSQYLRIVDALADFRNHYAPASSGGEILNRSNSTPLPEKDIITLVANKTEGFTDFDIRTIVHVLKALGVLRGETMSDIELAAKALLERGFHLGGSRRMAEKYPNQIVISDDTDWDFYCADTLEKRMFLSDLGFEKIECEKRNYWDNLLVDIFKHPTLPFEVLIRKDVDIYRSSFESLSAEVFIERLWKSSPVASPEIKECHKAKAKFKAGVCRYLNGIFALHR